MTAPNLDLAAPPEEEIPSTASSVAITVQEYSGTGAGPTAVVMSGACDVEVTSSDQPGATVFQATVTRFAAAGESGYICKITWTVRSAVGGSDDHVDTRVTVEGQVG